MDPDCWFPFPFRCSDIDVRLVARADVPALRGVLRPRGEPPRHPLGGQVRAGVAVLVSLPLLPGSAGRLLVPCLANVASAVVSQGVRALRQRAGRHRGDAATPRGEAGVAALRPRPARERRHRVRLKWRLRVRIWDSSLTHSLSHTHSLSRSRQIQFRERRDAFLCDTNKIRSFM
jgi:hypothetical protein